MIVNTPELQARELMIHSIFKLKTLWIKNTLDLNLVVMNVFFYHENAEKVKIASNLLHFLQFCGEISPEIPSIRHKNHSTRHQVRLFRLIQLKNLTIIPFTATLRDFPLKTDVKSELPRFIFPLGEKTQNWIGKVVAITHEEGGSRTLEFRKTVKLRLRVLSLFSQSIAFKSDPTTKFLLQLFVTFSIKKSLYGHEWSSPFMDLCEMRMSRCKHWYAHISSILTYVYRCCLWFKSNKKRQREKNERTFLGGAPEITWHTEISNVVLPFRRSVLLNFQWNLLVYFYNL